MSEEKPRRRKNGSAPIRQSVKATVRLDVATHARLSAAAALRGMDKNAFIVEALTEALRGYVVVDRNRPKLADPVDLSSSEGSASEAA